VGLAFYWFVTHDSDTNLEILLHDIRLTNSETGKILCPVYVGRVKPS